MKKWTAAVMAAVFMLTACGTQVATEKKNEKELEEVSIVLDWYPNAIHSFLYDAMEKGYYEQEGLKVNILFPANTNDAISLTAAGKADIGIYYQHDVIMARANEKVPVKAIGTLLQKTLEVVISPEENAIHSPKDLAGKTLGYSGSVIAETMIRTCMKHEGVKEDDFSMIDVGFDLMSAMTTGNVDATMGGMLNHEVPQLESEGVPVNYFFVTDYGVPDYYGMVFVAGDKVIEQKRDTLVKFMRATKKGFADMKADPDAALAILLEHQNSENFPLTQAVEEQSMAYLLPAMETEDAPFLSQDKEVWRKNIEYMKENGLLTGEVTAEELVIDLLE